MRNIDNPTRILVIDDDENVRKKMKTILTKKGYAVDLASSGNEAINRAKKTAYNVALIDIRLPDMEGVELLTKMRETVPKSRKIMITGYPTMQNAITSLNSKADAYLIKPVDPKKLLELIQEQIQLQKEEMEFSEQKVSDYVESRVREM